MKNMWAPWRMTYIETDVDSGNRCFLCAAFEEADDDKAFVLWKSEHTFCIMNRFPYNNGHLMITPNRHVGDAEELTTEEMTAIMSDTIRAQKVLSKVMHPHGFNWGLNIGREAGAGLVDHIHMHIVPRWSGDTNFMPVFADVKIIPQALEDLYAKLKKEVPNIP